MGLGVLRSHGKEFWFTPSPHHQKDCPWQSESVNQLNESSSFIPSIAMVNRLRGPVIPLFLAGFFLVLFILSLLTLAGRPERVEAQEECPSQTQDSPTVKASSRTPAANTSYEVKFVTTKELAPHTDAIVMKLHEDIGVPPAINPASVRVSFCLQQETDSVSRGRGTASNVELDGQDDPRHPTTLNIYPVIPGEGRGAQPIPKGATVTVTFQRNSGISNPTEGGAFSWRVGVDKDTLTDAQHPDEDVRAAFASVEGIADHVEKQLYGLLVDWEIQLSHEVVNRNEEVIVIGRGYKNGTTLTFWRDANFDGVRDSAEAQLCQTLVGPDDIGYCSFSVTKPAFANGVGRCDTVRVASTAPHDAEMRKAAEDANCNFINGVDGLNHSSIWVGELEMTSGDSPEYFYHLDNLPQVLDLHGRVTAETGAGQRLFIRLEDIPPGRLVEADIGGVPLDLGRLANSRIPASGSLHFSVDLPGATRRGNQTLRVALTHEAHGPQDPRHHHEVTTTIWVNPDAVVTAFPEQVLPNQRVSLEGKGFIEKDGVGEIASISIGGHVLDPTLISDGKEDPLATDGNGNWSGYIDLPINSATTTPGTREIQITDRHGRKGPVEVTIPPRELEALPIWGRPGDMITIKGRGFPARNANRSNVHLRIHYETANGYAVTNAEPDAAGNFSQEIRIPLDTPAPSSNTVRVEFYDDGGSTVVTTTGHEVAGATVTVSPEAGPPGTAVSLTGQGFRKFTKVSLVAVAGLDVAPSDTVTTDANGEFSLTFLAPGVGVGRQTVLVEVAGVTASATFDIKPPGVVAGAPMTVAEALEGLGDRLLRVFHFNNDTKVWAFYAPSVAADSTLELMVTGETYLVLVSGTTQAILNGESRNLTCHQGNCWNQIVW